MRRPGLQQVGESEGQVADGDHEVAAHRRLDRPARILIIMMFRLFRWVTLSTDYMPIGIASYMPIGIAS